jgi:hypothetical protein
MALPCRGRGCAAGAVSNRAHPSAAFKTLRGRALSCRRPQDVDRPVSLARSERLVLPSSSPGRRPVFRANSRRGLRPSSRRPLSGSPRCVRACAQHLTAILRIIPSSAFSQAWRLARRVPPCPPSDRPLSGAQAHEHRRPELQSTGPVTTGYGEGPRRPRPTAACIMGCASPRRARIRIHVAITITFYDERLMSLVHHSDALMCACTVPVARWTGPPALAPGPS